MADPNNDSATSEIKVTVLPIPPPTYGQKFLAVVTAFAEALELPLDTVVKRFQDKKILGTRTSDKAAEALANVSDAQFIAAFDDFTPAEVQSAAKALHDVLNPPAASPPAQNGNGGGVNPFGGLTSAQPQQALIPDVPGGSDLLKQLIENKVLNADSLTIRAALEAYWAHKLGTDQLPDRLAESLEAFAEGLDVPVTDEYFKVEEFIMARNYAEIGVKNRHVTQKRKDQFWSKFSKLPTAVAQFHSVLSAWNDEYSAARQQNPLAVFRGDSFNLFPPCDTVLAAADGVVAVLNQAFRGYGVITARACAYENRKIGEIIKDARIPALIGAGNYQQMIKDFDLGMTDADSRMEQSVAKYVIFVATQVKSGLTAENAGPFLEQLWRVGQSIRPWMDGTTPSKRAGGFGPSPYSGGGDNNAMAPNGRPRGAGSRDGLR